MIAFDFLRTRVIKRMQSITSNKCRFSDAFQIYDHNISETLKCFALMCRYVYAQCLFYIMRCNYPKLRYENEFKKSKKKKTLTFKRKNMFKKKILTLKRTKKKKKIPKLEIIK